MIVRERIWSHMCPSPSPPVSPNSSKFKSLFIGFSVDYCFFLAVRKKWKAHELPFYPTALSPTSPSPDCSPAFGVGLTAPLSLSLAFLQFGDPSCFVSGWRFFMESSAVAMADSAMLNLKLNDQKGAPGLEKSNKKAIGFLDVFVHQARGIHNICIYHKQDVYAKVSFTDDPDSAVATKTINGGGQNPVFNDGVSLAVHTVETSIKCEVWMMSRVQNYMQDQLLGFALVPLADVLVAKDGKLEQEFVLSSTELFHSPAGFVQLSLSYVGYAPEVIPISPPAKSALGSLVIADSGDGEIVASEFEKIEFPDLNVVKENELMVSEYFKIPCPEIDTLMSSDSLTKEANGKHLEEDAGIVKNLAKQTEEFRNGSPLSCVSTEPGTPQSVSEPSSNTITTSQSEKEKSQDATDGEADSPAEAVAIKPVISINLEPVETFKQQDIVNMYMKSMQQFTESLAKMKLPMDVANNGDTTDNSTSATENKDTPTGTGPKVFYGSRAFF